MITWELDPKQDWTDGSVVKALAVLAKDLSLEVGSESPRIQAPGVRYLRPPTHIAQQRQFKKRKTKSSFFHRLNFPWNIWCFLEPFLTVAAKVEGHGTGI